MNSLVLKNPRFLLGILLVAAAALALLFLPVEQLLRTLNAWAQAQGPWAALVVGALAALCILLLLPSAPVMMLCGFLFGIFKGLAVYWLAGLVASTLAFWLGRTLARPWIERRIRRNTAFIAIDRAIRSKAFLIVLLTRLVMFLPYQVLNYSLGLTSVGFRAYFFGTNLGMLLPMFLFAYLGASADSLTAVLAGEISLERSELLFAAIVLVFVIAAGAWIIRSAARVLREELATPNPPEV